MLMGVRLGDRGEHALARMARAANARRRASARSAKSVSSEKWRSNDIEVLLGL
jgi:hypothetical protein